MIRVTRIRVYRNFFSRDEDEPKEVYSLEVNDAGIPVLRPREYTGKFKFDLKNIDSNSVLSEWRPLEEENLSFPEQLQASELPYWFERYEIKFRQEIKEQKMSRISVHPCEHLSVQAFVFRQWFLPEKRKVIFSGYTSMLPCNPGR